MTSKNGGSFNAYDIQSNGYFYVEYSGTQNQVEFVLQSWSGGAEWAKVSPSETGTANGHAGHPPAEHRTHRFGHGAGRLE